MAGASTENTSGHKLDVDLNLVPFIDLLSTLVLFLLLTVVWVQIAAIPAGVDSRRKSSVSIVDNSKVLVRVSSRGYDITWPSSVGANTLPTSVRSLDELIGAMQHLIRTGKTPAASVSGDDTVEYGAVINALDTLKAAGFTSVALSTD